MDEFIQLITKQLGIGAADGKLATGGILKMIRDHLDPSMFSQMTEKLPEIQGLVSEAAKSGGAEESGGLMGSLTSLAGSMLGGKAKSAADITSTLTKAGISLDQIPQFLSMLVNFLKKNLGDEMFTKIAAQLPDLLGKGK